MHGGRWRCTDALCASPIYSKPTRGRKKEMEGSGGARRGKHGTLGTRHARRGYMGAADGTAPSNSLALSLKFSRKASAWGRRRQRKEKERAWAPLGNKGV